jgi:hypothetical protein
MGWNLKALASNQLPQYGLSEHETLTIGDLGKWMVYPVRWDHLRPYSLTVLPGEIIVSVLRLLFPAFVIAATQAQAYLSRLGDLNDDSDLDALAAKNHGAPI